MIVYTVMMAGFEYNDEIYHQPECGGGEPVKAFRNKSKAESFLIAQLRSFWGDHAPNEYTYEPKEIVNVENWYEHVFGPDLKKTNDVLEEGVDEHLSEDKWKAFFQSLADEQVLRFNEICTITPVYIQEIEVGD